MRVGVMHVGRVRMPVSHRLVAMGLFIRFARRVAGTVTVLVVLVADMRMGVVHHLVQMLMRMIFRQVEPDADAHEQASGHQLERQRLMQKDDGGNRSEEGSSREIGPRARRAKMPKRHNEEREAHPVTEKADETGEQQGR